MHEFISISRCVFKLSYYLFSNIIKALNIEIIAQTGDFRGLLQPYLSIAGSSETFPCNLMLTFTECIFMLGTLSTCYNIGFLKLLTVTRKKKLP